MSHLVLFIKVHVKFRDGECRPEIFRDAKPIPADESSHIPIGEGEAVLSDDG